MMLSNPSLCSATRKQCNSHKPYILMALRDCKSLISFLSLPLEQVRVSPMVNISLHRSTLGNNSSDKGVGCLALLGALRYLNNRLGRAALPTRGQGPDCSNWLKNKFVKRQQTRCSIKVEWRFDPGVCL